MSEVIFNAPQARCELHHPLASSREPLRAWESADEYLLREVELWREARGVSASELRGEAWLYGDTFGALALPLLCAYPQLKVRLVLELTPTASWLTTNLHHTLKHHPTLTASSLLARLSYVCLPLEGLEGGEDEPQSLRTMTLQTMKEALPKGSCTEGTLLFGSAEDSPKEPLPKGGCTEGTLLFESAEDSPKEPLPKGGYTEGTLLFAEGTLLFGSAEPPVLKPDIEPEGYLLALLKVPTHLSLWGRWLRHLSATLRSLDQTSPSAHTGQQERVLVLGGAMSKHVHTSTISVMERCLGETPTSLAWRKARLLKPTLSAPLPAPSAAPPLASYHVSATDLERAAPFELTLLNSVGVFAEAHLDQGARALLPHLSAALDQAIKARETRETRALSETAPLRVADLGCGDGVLSLTLATLALERGVPLQLELFDVAVSALESAALSWSLWRQRAHAPHCPPHKVSLALFASDCLSAWRARADDERQPFDLILNNPPFHQQGAQTSALSAQMFDEARRALTPWGSLWVVGNRHLGYHQQLKAHFERVSSPSAHPKFVVLVASAPRASELKRMRAHALKPVRAQRARSDRRGRR